MLPPGKIMVSTNGTLVTEEKSNILAKNADQIDLSVDGVDEETTSKVRGSGVFDRVMRAIKRLQGNGFTNLSLSRAMTDRNEYLEKRFDQFCEKLQVLPVKRKFSLVGRGEKFKELFSEKNEKESYVPESFKKTISRKYLECVAVRQEKGSCLSAMTERSIPVLPLSVGNVIWETSRRQTV